MNLKGIEKYLVLYIIQKKLVNGYQSIVLGVDVKRTSKQWISINYLYARLCYITCDVLCI